MKSTTTTKSTTAFRLCVLALALCSAFGGCKLPEVPSKNTGRFVLVSEDEIRGEILRVYRDTKTGREYLSTKQGYSGGVCALQ